MTHCFYFDYHTQRYHFIWDNESGSLHNVDYVAFLVAKNKYSQPLIIQEKVDFDALDKHFVDEISKELDEVEKLGQLNSPCDIKANSKRIGEIKALCLHICHDCNLRCKYCFASDGTYNTTAKEYMSAEVGKRAIDYLIAHSGKRHSLEVDFFGGEPLMNIDVVKEIVDYARSQEDIFNKKFDFTMTTNCLLLNQDNREWLDKEMVNVVLSIDGRKNIHEAVRLTPNKKSGSYDVILNNALEFRAIRQDRSYYVRGTFTAQNLDFANDVLDLNDKGFDQISMEPVVTDIDELAIKQEHIPAILDEYERLAVEYIDRRKTDKWFNFFHFMIDLDGGPCITKSLTGCGSGCEYFSVVPNGDVYPCHQFAEKEGYKMGNVFDNTLDLDISKQFAKNIVTNKPDCQNCMAKYYCSGGCIANNLNYAGSMDLPHELSCQMMRKRLELSLAISAIERSEQQ